MLTSIPRYKNTRKVFIPIFYTNRMVAESIKNFIKLVDVSTEDRELAQRILEDYPGKIKGDQYQVDTSEPDKNPLYCFYNLDRKEIIRFLRKDHKSRSYDIRDSFSGEFLHNSE